MATPVLWRTEPEEVRPFGEEKFSAKMLQAAASIPDEIRDWIHSIYAEHADQFLRNYLTGWIFIEAWRWGDGWAWRKAVGGIPRSAGSTNAGGRGDACDRGLGPHLHRRESLRYVICPKYYRIIYVIRL